MKTIAHRLTRCLLAAAALLLWVAGPAAASEVDYCSQIPDPITSIQSRTQLRNFVRCAERHLSTVGWDQALEDFASDTRWYDGSMYLFGLNMDGITLFNIGGLGQPGEDNADMVDADGKPFLQRMIYTVETFGEGYTSYRVRRPETTEPTLKLSYVYPVDIDHEGDRAFIGAGYFPIDAPGTCSPEEVRASLVHSLTDLERFVRCAELHIEHNGLRALFDLKNDPRWKSGPTYLFLIDRDELINIMHGVNPSLEGAYVGDLEDSTGYRYIEEFAHHAEFHGGGISYYEFTNPATGMVEPKISHVKNVEISGFNYILGAGIYVPSDPACLNMPAAQHVDTTAELETFVHCAADLIAARGEEAFDLLLHHPSWNYGSTYIFVTDQACRSLVYPLAYRADEDSCDATDVHGVEVDRMIRDIANGEAGMGYLSYTWLNPATDTEEDKTSYVVGVELAGETVAVGAGIYLSDRE